MKSQKIFSGSPGPVIIDNLVAHYPSHNGLAFPGNIDHTTIVSGVNDSSSSIDERAGVETNLDDLPLITPFVAVVDRVRSRLPHSEVDEDCFFPQHVPFCTMILVLSILS